MKNKSVQLYGAIFSILTVCAVISLIYFQTTGPHISNQTSDWGAFGSFVAGIWGVGVATCALLAIIYGIELQKKELSNFKKQFEEQRRREKLSQMKIQYFSSIELIGAQTSHPSQGTTIHKGRDALRKIIRAACVVSKDESDTNIQAASDILESSARNCYVQMIYIIDFILNFFYSDEKPNELDLFLAQLSEDEILLAIYLSQKKLRAADRHIIYRANLFEHLSPATLKNIPRAIHTNIMTSS